MNARHLVDDVPQQIAALHAVIDAAKHRRNYVAAVVAVRAGKPPQISKKARSLLPVWTACLVLIDEGKKLIARNALRIGCPVAPTIRRLDCRAKLLTAELRLLLALLLKIIHEFMEHDPSEKRQPVEVAV